VDDITVFPEMKTALRTYHPVPSLQKTDGNAQDAPRIKNCLKAALLPSELKAAPPSTPDEVLAKLVRGPQINNRFILTRTRGPANIHRPVSSTLFLYLPITQPLVPKVLEFSPSTYHFNFDSLFRPFTLTVP